MCIFCLCVYMCSDLKRKQPHKMAVIGRQRQMSPIDDHHLPPVDKVCIFVCMFMYVRVKIFFSFFLFSTFLPPSIFYTPFLSLPLSLPLCLPLSTLSPPSLLSNLSLRLCAFAYYFVYIYVHVYIYIYSYVFIIHNSNIILQNNILLLS